MDHTTPHHTTSHHTPPQQHERGSMASDLTVTVRSLQGSFLVSGVSSSSTVWELKSLLHQQHGESAPPPDAQRLVFRHEVLSAPDVALAQLGITHGDQVVLLPVIAPVKRPRAQTTPAADTAAIRAAITEEARRRGIEHTLKEERPPAARRGGPGGALALSDELLRGAPDELIQLLQRALDGQLPPGLRLSSSDDGSGGEQQQQQHGEDEDEDEEEEEDDEEEEQELVVPELPTDRIAQLTEMGFSDVLARNALLLHRSNVQHALEWLLEHGENPAAAEPPTQEQLQQIYGAQRPQQQRRRRGAAPVGRPGFIAGVSTEQLVSELSDMGFDPAAAQAVLARVGPQLDLAVQLLLGGGQPGGGGGRQQRSSSGGGSGGGGGAAGAAAAAAAAVQPGSSNGGGDAGAPPPAGGGSDATGQQQAAADPQGGSDEDDEFGDEFAEDDEDEDDEYEDEEEDEYFDGSEAALFDLPLQGAMQLANLGSADMEQLLAGANLQELALGNQLLMPGGIEAAGGGQSSLARLLEAPGFLQQLGPELAGAAAHQQQQQTGPAEEQQGEGS